MKRLVCAERAEKTGRRRAWGLCACVALCWLGARAVEVSTVDELVAAMTAVNEGTSTDTKILLKPGYYDVSGCTMNSDGHLYVARAMQFEGVDDTSWRTTASSNTAVVIDAKGINAIFRLDVSSANKVGSGTSFRNITFQNGNGRAHANLHGGAVSSSYGGQSHTASNCVFRGNEAYQGGALMRCTVYDCFFTNNVAEEGGAVCAAIDMHDSLFIDNRANSNGGVARNGGRMKRCVFIGNRAGRGSCAYGLVEVSDSICRSNVSSAGLSGGQVGGACFRAQNGTETCEVSGCRFEGNVSESDGPSCVYRVTLVTNCVFVGNSSRGDGAGVVQMMTNTDAVVACSFTNNVSWSTSKRGKTLGGAGVTGVAVAGNPLPKVTACVFVGNVAWNGGGVSLADVSNCLFVANCATNGAGAYQCAVSDSRFVSNTAMIFGGGAYDCSGLTHCTFQDCAAQAEGGAAYESSLFDCLVTNCTALTHDSIAGAAASPSCVAQRTTFVDCQNATNANQRWATGGLRLTDCTFIRCGAGRNSSAVRCTFTGMAEVGRPGHVLSGGVATNCLVTGCSAGNLFGWMAEIVNCTVVSNNRDQKGGQLFAGGIRAVNCIFRENYHDGGKSFDIAGYGACTFENCLYKTEPNWDAYTLAVTACVTNGVNPFLAPTHRDYDPAHPYAIGRRSPARNAGKTIDWPAGFTDLAGRPRVCDDRTDSPRVDIGAYECCLPRRGSCLVVR